MNICQINKIADLCGERIPLPDIGHQLDTLYYNLLSTTCHKLIRSTFISSFALVKNLGQDIFVGGPGIKQNYYLSIKGLLEDFLGGGDVSIPMSDSGNDTIPPHPLLQT